MCHSPRLSIVNPLYTSCKSRTSSSLTFSTITYLEKSQQTTHSEHSKDFGHLKDRRGETPCGVIGRLVNNDVDNGQNNYKQVKQVPFVLKVVPSECQSLLENQNKCKILITEKIWKSFQKVAEHRAYA